MGSPCTKTLERIATEAIKRKSFINLVGYQRLRGYQRLVENNSQDSQGYLCLRGQY